MGNRMIKETIRTSRTVNNMTDFQFRLWMYLITYVDDFGRGSADPELLKGLVFPRRKRVTESDIRTALAELAGMGCVNLYDVDGEPYFYFPNWGEHQRMRTKREKFPAPAAICGELRQSAASCGEMPPETKPNQTELETELETETKPNSLARDDLFDEFWSLYPKKTSKQEARKSFAKLKVTTDLFEKIKAALSAQKQSKQWQRENGQYIPYPATWLNQRRWEDEIYGGDDDPDGNSYKGVKLDGIIEVL